jgi:hypothetical protein
MSTATQQQIADLQQAIANLQTAHANAVSTQAKRQITANLKRLQQQLAFFTK